MFSIKLLHGGHFEENLKQYSGGQFHYIDICDMDNMSIIELISMLKECGEIWAYTFNYKWPKEERDVDDQIVRGDGI